MRHLYPIVFTFFCLLALIKTSHAQTSIPASTVVTENFNSVGSAAAATLPANWRMSPSGNAVGAWSAGITTTTQAASSGTPATGGRYNWATTAGTDRAIGFLTDGSYNTPNAVMTFYRNTTGASVNSVTIAFAVERYIVNTGAFSLSFASSTDGTAWTAQTAGDIATGLFATGVNAGTFGSPKTIYRTVTVAVTVPNNGDIYFRWVFNTSNANSQGLGLDDVSVFAGTATPVLVAELQDILQVDNGIPNQFNEGDVIRYQTVIKNIGTGNANNVQISIPPPPNTTLIGGSIKTSAVAVDDNYATSFNTVLNGTTVLANDFGVPLPTAVQSFGPVSNPAATAAGSAGTTSAGGTLTVNAAGTFTYTPPTGYSGIDQFKYVTGNGNLPNNDALVTITVAPDITFTTTLADPLCNGGTNGSITFNAAGGNGTLTYSITGAAGTFQASNIFTGLAPGTYNLAVKDAGGIIKTGTVTLNNPALIVVSGTILNLVYNTTIATASFTRTGGLGIITWSATGLPTGVSINSSTGDVTGTPSQTGSFNAIITATGAGGCTGTRNISFTVAPKLSNDAYNVVGNTQLVANGHSAPATPFTSDATNIITNDVPNAAITVTAGTFATTNGGSITINAAGKFTYTPLNGSLTADSYTYTATSNGVSATATINFTVASVIWYVNNTYAGGNGAANGSSHRPYTDVASAEAASAINQIIYVHTGAGNTTGNALLKSGQILRGAGSALSVGALSIAAGTNPTLTGMITLANSVTVDGFDMSTGGTTAITSSGATSVTVSVGNITTSGAANSVTLTNTTGSVIIAGGSQTNSTGATFNINGGTVSLTYSGVIKQAANAAMVSVSGGHATGTITFQAGILNATNGTGLQFDNADGTYNFNGTTILNGGDAGIDMLNGSAGTFSFASGTAITNPTNEAIKINASTANVTYSGTFSKTNNAVNGILINGETGGTININGTGTKTLSTSTTNAINLTSNTGATINFSGNNLSLTTTSGIGFNASGGATAINVTGTGNTISSGTGIALNVATTTIGASGLNFQSISANGGTNGIVLNTTGAGGLTVTGDGGGSNNNSGGIIQNTTSHGVLLNNVTNVRLNYLGIINNLGSGISGGTINGFQLNRCNITGNGNDAATDESGINVTQLTGTAIAGANPTSITNCTISNNWEFEIQITNTSGTLTDLQMSGNSISANGLQPNHGSLVNFLGHTTANMTLNVTSGTFTGNTDISGGKIITGTGVSAVNQGTNHTVNVSGATFTNNNVGVDCSSDPINTVFNFNISGNTFIGTRAAAVNSFHNGNAPFARTINGKILNNLIGNATLNSGSTVGRGIDISNEGAVPIAILISGNTIREIQSFEAMSVNVGLGGLATGGGLTNVTITNNTIMDIRGSRGLIVQDNQDPALGPFPTICANISGNTFSGVIAGQAGNGQYMRIRRLNGTVNVTQAAATAAAIATELDGANGFNDPTKIGISGTVNFSRPACTLPSN